MLCPYIFTCLHAYVSLHVYVTFVTRVLQIFKLTFDVKVHVSLGGHNLGNFYARKLKFYTQTYTFNSLLELPLGHALG